MSHKSIKRTLLTIECLGAIFAILEGTLRKPFNSLSLACLAFAGVTLVHVAVWFFMKDAEQSGAPGCATPSTDGKITAFRE